MARKSKKQKDNYYHIDEVLSHNGHYSIIYGERSNGKSYSAKDFALKHFVETGMKFIYLRRFEADITKAYNTQYLSDSSVNQLFGDNFILNDKAGKIYVEDTTEDKELKKDPVHVGYIRALSNAQRYSSGAYLDCDVIIFEEFVSLKGEYLPFEFELFMHFVSTVARRRNITVILIGNSLSRLCPYFREFQLTHILDQKEGTIDEYYIDNESDTPTKIVVQFADHSEVKTSSMFFGTNAEMTNQGKWHTRPMPHLPSPIDEWHIGYTFYLKYHDFKYSVKYITNNIGDFALYVEEWDKPLIKEYRVIDIESSVNSTWTCGFVALSQDEAKIFRLLLIGKVFYSDNLVGTEFNEVYKRFHHRETR